MMIKKQKKPLTPEEIIREHWTVRRHCLEKFTVPSNIPLHRQFKVGDKVRVGNLEDPVVDAILDGGKFYLIRHKETKLNESEFTIFEWMSVKPLRTKPTEFADAFDLRANYSNTCLEGLLNKVYHFGVDFNPSYQRGLVWTTEQKQALIKTIFDIGSIGTFAFNRRSYDADVLYEVIDGKQRLSALCEFYEDRWPYNGAYYSELSIHDTSIFKNASTPEVVLQEATEEHKLRLFLRINRAGTPVDVEHIHKVEEMLKLMTEVKP
jgi:hypothetical protein